MRLIAMFTFLLTACQEKLDLTAPLLWVKVLDDPEWCTGRPEHGKVWIRCENAPEIQTYAQDVRIALDPKLRNASCTIKHGWWNIQITLTLPTDLNLVSDKFTRREFRHVDWDPNRDLCESTVTNGHDVLRHTFGLTNPQPVTTQR